ncbi:MAG: hypothetical protein HC919_00380 [Oscillatoriales cyanobacterium SM2_2_1]|nr:hypothetical protein [Oscillatoriales cyanobacterium SM2_2_1]
MGYGQALRRHWWALTLLAACAPVGKPEVVQPKPTFLMVQVAPNGKTLEAITPRDLVTQEGTLGRVVQSLPKQGEFEIIQFGKVLASFQTTDLGNSDILGAITIFRVEQSQPELLPQALRRMENLVIVPKGTAPSHSVTYQYTCPPMIQPLILQQGRRYFAALGARPQWLNQAAIASLVCVDIDLDGQSEMVAGLRLDNPLRPIGTNEAEWQKFLSRSVLERQEYSILLLLRRIETGWIAEPILTHTRALAYLNDSIVSYVLAGAEDLNGDRALELIIREIGLNTVDAHVVAPVIEEGKSWRWQRYYRSDRPLAIVE